MRRRKLRNVRFRQWVRWLHRQQHQPIAGGYFKATVPHAWTKDTRWDRS